MKHLKTYKIFEDNYEQQNKYRTISEEVQKEADDYLSDLKDNGYRISVSSYPSNDDIQVCILICGKRFRWIDVKSDIKRLIGMTHNELDSIVCHDESRQTQTHFSSIGEIPHETEMSFLQIYFNYKGNLLESDSWAGSLYAYNTVSTINTDSVIVPRKTFDLNCNDCGISFDSFSIEDICKNCGSENTGPVNINPV